MNKLLAVEMEQLSAGTRRELREKDEVLFYQQSLFVGEHKIFVKAGFGNGQVSL
jgi:hypothetical protein